MIKFYDCDSCKNLIEIKNGMFSCKAFPNGVPFEHMDRDLKKIKQCNNGIGYEPKNKND